MAPAAARCSGRLALTSSFCRLEKAGLGGVCPLQLQRASTQALAAAPPLLCASLSAANVLPNGPR